MHAGQRAALGLLRQYRNPWVGPAVCEHWMSTLPPWPIWSRCDARRMSPRRLTPVIGLPPQLGSAAITKAERIEAGQRRVRLSGSGAETSSPHMRCCLQALKTTFVGLDAAGRTHARLHFSDPGAFRIAEMLIQGQSHADLDPGTLRLWVYTNAERLRLSIDLCPHDWRSATQPSALTSPVPMAVAGPTVAAQVIPPAPF